MSLLLMIYSRLSWRLIIRLLFRPILRLIGISRRILSKMRLCSWESIKNSNRSQWRQGSSAEMWGWWLARKINLHLNKNNRKGKKPQDKEMHISHRISVDLLRSTLYLHKIPAKQYTNNSSEPKPRSAESSNPKEQKFHNRQRSSVATHKKSQNYQ